MAGSSREPGAQAVSDEPEPRAGLTFEVPDMGSDVEGQPLPVSIIAGAGGGGDGGEPGRPGYSGAKRDEVQRLRRLFLLAVPAMNDRLICTGCRIGEPHGATCPAGEIEREAERLRAGR